MNIFLEAEIVDVEELPAEQRVILDPDDHPVFGTFDGYLTGVDGKSRFATSPSQVGEDVEVILNITNARVSSIGKLQTTIQPNENSPRSYQGHTIIGRVETEIENLGEILKNTKKDINRYGNSIYPSSVPLETKIFDQETGHLISVGDDLIIAQDLAGEFETGSYIEIKTIRIDVLGYL